MGNQEDWYLFGYGKLPNSDNQCICLIFHWTPFMANLIAYVTVISYFLDRELSLNLVLSGFINNSGMNNHTVWAMSIFLRLVCHLYPLVPARLFTGQGIRCQVCHWPGLWSPISWRFYQLFDWMTLLPFPINTLTDIGRWNNEELAVQQNSFSGVRTIIP